MNNRTLSPLRFPQEKDLHEFIEELVSLKLMTVTDRDGLKTYNPSYHFNHEFIVGADQNIYFLPHVQEYLNQASVDEIEKHPLKFLCMGDDEISLHELQNMPLDIRKRRLTHILMDEPILSAYNSGVWRALPGLILQEPEYVKKVRHHFRQKKLHETAQAVSGAVRSCRVSSYRPLETGELPKVPTPSYLHSLVFSDLTKLLLLSEIKLKYFIMHRSAPHPLTTQFSAWEEEVDRSIENIKIIMRGQHRIYQVFAESLTECIDQYKTLSEKSCLSPHERSQQIRQLERSYDAQVKKYDSKRSLHKFLKPFSVFLVFGLVPIVILAALAAIPIIVVSVVAPIFLIQAAIISSCSALIAATLSVGVVALSSLADKVCNAQANIYRYFDRLLTQEIIKADKIKATIASLSAEAAILKKYPEVEDEVLMKRDFFAAHEPILQDNLDEVAEFELQERECYSPQLRSPKHTSVVASGFNIFKYEDVLGLPQHAMRREQDLSPRELQTSPVTRKP